jgi:hypothetical protein
VVESSKLRKGEASFMERSEGTVSGEKGRREMAAGDMGNGEERRKGRWYLSESGRGRASDMARRG